MKGGALLAPSGVLPAGTLLTFNTQLSHGTETYSLLGQNVARED